ncbi:hypothetical protein D3C73_835610 [compost metagenome]
MVANCLRCGRVFQKNHRNQCTQCSSELDSAMSRCHDFLRKNYKSTSEQVSLATAVPIEQIVSWIKEGRLLISDYPNLNYPCSSCGTAIRKHKMCTDCSQRLTREIQMMNDQHARRFAHLEPIASRAGSYLNRGRV